MTFWIPMRDILVKLPEELIIELDEGAKRSFMYRSEYIRHILQKHVRGKYPEVIDRIHKDPDQWWRLLDLDD